MNDVRAGVDAIDRHLVALLAQRFRYMDAAARIKPEREQVRDEARKTQVIANVRREAQCMGVAPELAERMWDQLVEASIAHEYAAWDARHKSRDRAI